MTASAPPRVRWGDSGDAPVSAAPRRARRFAAPAAAASGAAACGLALALAFPPVGAWPLAPLAVGTLTLLVRGRTARAGALLGVAAGLGFFVALLSWLRVVGVDAWLLLAAVQALFFAPLGAGLALVTRLPGWPVWTATLWVGEEALRARVPFGGFPWGKLAFSQPHGPLATYAALGGAPLSGALTALLGAALAAALAGRARPRAAAAWAAVAALVLLAGVLLPTPTRGERRHGPSGVVVAAVQGNVPRLGLDFLGQRRAVLDNHVRESARLAAAVDAGRLPAPDAVVWPENSSDLDPYRDATARASITKAVRRLGVPVLVGAITGAGDGARVHNVGIVWDPARGPGATYVKRHPVPFGEYLPFRPLLTGWIGRFARIPRDFAPGARPGVLSLGPARIGDVICFEVADDGVVRDVVRGGARLLVVQTNNATYGRTGQTEQQLAIARVRAIEHGRSVVVAATSGISAFIEPDGRVRHRGAEFRPALLVGRLPLRDTPTVAGRLGAGPEWALAAVGLLAVVAAMVVTTVAARRRKRDPRIVPGSARVGPVLVVIPTFDERENLERTVRRVRVAVPDADLLVVDDASPDGTGSVADALAAADPRVHVLHRPGKAGLGAAYVAGFRWGLARHYGVFVEMDADGSHAPEELPRLLAALRHADLVVGSRWVAGGAVRDWPRSRRLLSRGGNVYTRLVLGVPLHDATGGFRGVRRQVLERLPLEEIRSAGYCFQVDLAWRALRAGFRVTEVPITFVERTAGASKMNRAIVAEALWRVTWWGVARIGARTGRGAHDGTAPRDLPDLWHA